MGNLRKLVKVCLVFMVLKSVLAFDKEDITGIYLNSGYRSNPDAFGVSVGGESFLSNNFSLNFGFIAMYAEPEDYHLYGIEFGGRIYFGTRISPFIGLGCAFGKEEIVLHIERDSDGEWSVYPAWPEEEYEPIYYDEYDRMHSLEEKESEWTATVFPEVGIKYFIHNDFAVTYTCKYHITSGLTENFYTHYLTLSWS